MKSISNEIHYFNSPNKNFRDILNNPNSSLEDILSLNDFISYWIRCDSSLYNFIIDHCDELIEIGFQIKQESHFSIRCLQIISTNNIIFRRRLFSETNILRFTYDYLFHISSYPIYSQKNYFYVLPNIMIDPQNKLNPKFDKVYFTELFKHVENEYIYSFCLKLICSSPSSIIKVLKHIDPSKIIVSNLLSIDVAEQNNDTARVFLRRNQSLFKRLIGSKIEGNASIHLYNQIDEIVKNAIQNRNSSTLSFLCYVDEYSSNKFYFSKWKSIHYKIVPYLTSFCEIVLKSNLCTFTPLFESCVMLSIRIISTNKSATDQFKNLFKKLSSLFFELKSNSFLHNCFIQSFDLLLSLKEINSQFLDELNLFNQIIQCYQDREKDCASSYWGHLRLISEAITHFVADSKTVDTDKWNKIVVNKNQASEKIITKNYGGHIPFNTNTVSQPGLSSILLIGGATVGIALICFAAIFIANEF